MVTVPLPSSHKSLLREKTILFHGGVRNIGLCHEAKQHHRNCRPLQKCDSATTFIPQVIAQRKELYICPKKKQSRYSISHRGSWGCQRQWGWNLVALCSHCADSQWFYCNQQREEQEDLECFPLMWLGINEQTCTAKEGYTTCMGCQKKNRNSDVQHGKVWVLISSINDGWQ